MRTHRPASAPLRIITKAGAALGRQLTCFAGAALLFGGPALAQIGGAYDLTRNTVDGGGATLSTGGGYAMGGTIGQPDAGTLSGGSYDLRGGFWSQVAPVPTPTATHTGTRTFTPTPSRTPTLPSTLPPTTTPSHTLTTATPAPSPTTTVIATAAITPTGTRLATATATATPTPSATPPSPCTGDCNRDAGVTVDELLVMVNIALGNAPVSGCPLGDANGDGEITIDEILQAVNNALGECPVAQVCGGIAGLPCPTGEFCELPAGMCNTADLTGVCVGNVGLCPAIFAPVCGCDGVTYPNDCGRGRAGVAKDHDGPC